MDKMTNEEIARKAALRIVKLMAIKAGILIAINKWAKHEARKIAERKAAGL